MNILQLADEHKLIAPGDVAVYGTLCALASFPRSAIKSKILENSAFAVFIEQEPYIRELVASFMSSNFKNVLEILDRYSVKHFVLDVSIALAYYGVKTRHYLDIHLFCHVNELMNSIRNSAVILYFQPFATIKLERMSAAFGWSLDEVEHHVVNLIQSGGIQGRVDSQNKVRTLSGFAKHLWTDFPIDSACEKDRLPCGVICTHHQGRPGYSSYE
jgi:COP9 signalosome complex subunit 1